MLCGKCGWKMKYKIVGTGKYICLECETRRAMADTARMLRNERRREARAFLKGLSAAELRAELRKRKGR